MTNKGRKKASIVLLNIYENQEALFQFYKVATHDLTKSVNFFKTNKLLHKTFW